jgi:hypothetical protein
MDSTISIVASRARNTPVKHLERWHMIEGL